MPGVHGWPSTYTGGPVRTPVAQYVHRWPSTYTGGPVRLYSSNNVRCMPGVHRWPSTFIQFKECVMYAWRTPVAQYVYTVQRMCDVCLAYTGGPVRLYSSKNV